MYFNATLKGPMRAFMLILIYLVWLVGLPLGKTSAKELPVTNNALTNNAATWWDNYLFYHPHSPLLSSAWRTNGNYFAGDPGTIWSYGQEQSPVTGGVACAACSVTTPALAVDGDTTTSSTLTVPLGVIGTIGQFVKLSGVYQAGDSIVLFLEAPTEDLAGVVLPRVKVTTYNNSIDGPAVSNNDGVNLDAAVVKLELLGIGLNNARKFRVTIPATKTFDGIQVDFGGLVGISGALKLYEVAAMIPVTALPQPAKTAYNTPITLTPSIRISNPVFRWYTTPQGGSPIFTGPGAFTTPSLTRNTTYYVEAEDNAGTASLIRTAVPVTIGGGTGPLWTYGTGQQAPIMGGVACALCNTQNPAFAADGDTTTASHLSLPLGIAATLGQKISFPGIYHSGDSIILILGAEADILADASVLGSIKVTTSLNNVSNNDGRMLTDFLLDYHILQGINGIRRVRIAIPVSHNFDAAQIDVSSLLGASNSIYIYEAIAMTPVTVAPSPATINAGATATLNATLPNIPGAIFNWYETPEGGSPIYTGSSFKTPPLFQNKTYYVEAISPADGLVSITRTAVAVNVNNASGNGQLSCSGSQTQSAGTGGIACLLCTVDNPALAVDNNPATASTVRLGVGALGYVYQDLVFPIAGKAGDTVRLGLGTTTGVLDLSLLGSIGVGLGNGARPTDAEMGSLQSDLLTARILNGVQQNAYTFVANKTFDRVEIRLNTLVGAITVLNVYYAQIVTPVAQVAAGNIFTCSGSPAILSATGPAGYTLRWYTSYTGGAPVGYGPSFTTPVITKDTTYFVEAAGADSCGSERRTPVQVKTGLPGVVVTPSSASVVQGATPTFSVVSPNPGYIYNWYSVPTGGTPVFVGTQFTSPPVTGNATYYAEAVLQGNPGCKSLRTPVAVTLNGDSGPETPGDIDCGGATSQQITTSGLCIGCFVQKQDSAVDNSTATASVMHTVLGVGGNIQQSLIFPTTGTAGDSVRIKLGFVTGLADLGLLTGIQISSSNNTTSNNDAVTLSPEMLNLKLLNGNRDLIYSFGPGKPFDRVNIKLIGQLAGLIELKVYSAQMFAGVPTVEKDTVYVCQGGTATLRATGPGTSFRWYNQPVGGSVLSTNATYQVSGVTNAIYYVEAVSSSGCADPVRKPVYVIVGLPQPLVTPAVSTINSGQTATFTINNPNPAYQYNWYNAPAGGTLLQGNATSYTTPALTADAVYYVEVRDPVNNCTSPTRTAVRAEINRPNEPTPCSYAAQQVSPVIAGICLLCSVADPALAVDQNSNSASTITSTLSAVGYVGQLLRFGNTYPAGDSVTLDLEIPGQVADAALLGGVRLETYNGNTANGDAIFLNNPAVHLMFLNTGNKFRVTLPVTKAFNGVLVSINGLLTALTRVKVYFAAVVTQRAQVTATVNLCSGNTATLTATSANGADLAWYATAVGGTPLSANGTYVTPVLTASATYYVEASRFGCANPVRTPVSVNVGTTPAAPTAAGKSACAGNPVTLLATAPAGATFRWYSAATGGTLLASTANYTTNILTADTAFYVEADDNGCKSTTRTRVPVTVSPAPGNLTVTPPATSILRGQGAIFTANATGANVIYKWYSMAGDSIFTGAVFNTGPLAATTTYTVEAVNAGGCKSGPRVSVTATVVAGSNDIPCDAATSQENSANGLCVGCYVENPTLSVDNSTLSKSTLHVVLGLLNGYVQQTLIFPQISEPADSVIVALSLDSALVDIGLLAGVEIGSYNGAVSNNDFIALNNPLIKLTILGGNQQLMAGFKPKALFDRLVIRLRSGTVSALTEVNVHFASRVAGLPVVKGDTVCTGNRATLTASGPANVSFRWYTTATGGNAISTGTSYQTPVLTANTTYYVEVVKTSLNCPNPQRVAVTAIVDPVPGVPVLDTTALAICSGSKATFNVEPVAGVIYRWYTAPAGGTLLFTGPSYTTPNLTATTAYYIEASNATGCTNTTRKMVTVNIVGRPDAPVVTTGNVTICANNSAELTATSATPGAAFRWYTTATGGTPVFVGASFQTPVLTSSTTYYVEAAAGACASASRTAAVVIVNQVPAAPTVTTVPVNGEVVSGQSAILTASSATPGVVFNWYTVATGGSPVFTGAVFTTPALTSGITYYVEAVAGAGGCPGQRTAVPLTVTVVPNTVCDFANAQINSTTAVCALCSVVDAQNTTDADVNNYSILSVPLAAGGGSVQQSLIFPEVAAAGDSVRIVMELPAQVIDASLLSALEVSSFNGATANNDAMLLNNGNLSIRLLNGSDKFTVAFAPGAAYDRVQVRLRGGVITALVKAYIYYATRQVSAPIVAARNVTICSGNTATLTATASSVARLEWYDAPVGGQKVFEGASFVTPVLTATKTYYVQSVRTSNDCANPNRVSVTVSVVPGLVAPTVNNAAICAGQQATLTATVTGQNIQTRWYSAPTGGTLLFTGTTYVTNALNADTAFYVETGNGACTLSSRVKATVTVGGNAPAPVLEDQNVNICAGSTATFKVTSATAGITYKWYTTLTGGTAVETGTTFTTPMLSATTVYYVEASSNSSACGQASARVAASAIVSTTPPVPVLESDNVSTCTGGTATLRVVSGTTGVTYNWYTVATGGTPVASGPEFTTPVLNNTTTYYVEAVNTNNQCTGTSARVPATVTVGVSPDVPVLTFTNPIIICAGDNVTLFVKNPDPAFTYRWYTTATGGTPIATGSSFTTPVVNAAVNYYVEAVNGNCTSPARAEAAIFVSTAPPVPVLESNNVSICTGETATLRVTSSTNGMLYSWYTVATGGTPVEYGPEFTTPALTNTTTYYVDGTTTNNQCIGTSARVAVTVTVGVSPDIPVLTAASVRVCAGQDVTLSVQNPQAGITYQWFNAPTGGTLVFTGNSFTVTAVNADASYYVQATLGATCVSASRAAASITVDAAAPTPDVVAANVITCVGGTATFNVSNPDAALTYRWYDAPANGTLLASGPEYTTAALNSNTTFYVEALNGSGCSSQARKGVTATVVNTIDAPLADGTTICAGQSAVLNVKDPLAGISYKWYTAATGGTPIFIGAAFTTEQLSANTTYYVEAATGGCISQSRTIVPVTVNVTPSAPVISGNTVSTVCPNQIATLSIQNPSVSLTYRWYTSLTGGTPVATGSSIMTPAITANTTYYVDATNTSGCTSTTRTPVSITVNASAGNPTVTGNEAGICPGNMATLAATSTTANAGFRWYTTATGGALIAAGATFITPALNQNTTYYVEAVTEAGCISPSRTAVQVNILEPLAPPVITVTEKTPTQVTFTWTAVPGAIAYQVTLDNGVTYVVPSSGAEGLAHVVSGLAPAQSVTIRVKAVGNADCETSALSDAVTGTTENPQGNNIFVPNVFTPNGDGMNDVHYVYGNTIANIVVRYYNQFGQQIFETKDQRVGWDGTMGGRQQPVGVYIYVLRATLQDGTVVDKKGTVTIVR
ncbi:Ig-like domain-containing protein [Chitinophaga filiformis]|uniref:Gliding motility-associated C-terminal domain-containing protein n=1 Tax=Chitinophaga filiformis TaxID=104663 RepID=A0A1G7IXU5_CHIFI|nr:gliding motility-associated C-terminal domain-containing protein [Chitinophaga filiformis]SDF17416.1 gliding motility-associated C-terminal domain-containing protein [Chitinophaga filiformis]